MSSSLTLALTISGEIGSITLEPETLTYALTGQDAGLGPQALKVPAGAAAKSVAAKVAAMSQQGVLLIFTDKEVTYEINGDGEDRTIKEGAFAIHPGGPTATALAFGGNGSTDADVTIFQLGLT